LRASVVLLFRLILVVTLISSAASPQQTPLPQLPPGVTTQNVKFTTFTNVTSAGSIGAPGSNPNRLPLPTDGTAVKVERTELHVYSMELSNDGPKAIKAFAWDFIFAEPRTNVEQLRHSLANVQKIEVGQKKTARFTTALSPPKVVDATALGKDPRARFREYATLQCVLFADGSTWELPNASGKPCDRLARWLERRKSWRPGIEDLPFDP
jgi:hypothetical protein